MLQYHSSDAFRIFVAMHHYRAATNYSDAKMADATAVLGRLVRFVREHGTNSSGPHKWTSADAALSELVLDTRDAVFAALADDVQTNEALHRVLELVSAVNKSAATSGKGEAAHLVGQLLGALGVRAHVAAGPARSADGVVAAAVALRDALKAAAKQSGDARERARLFEACDKARAALAECGVEVRDGSPSAWAWRV